MEIRWLALTIERRVLLQETRGVKNGVCVAHLENCTLCLVSLFQQSHYFSLTLKS